MLEYGISISTQERHGKKRSVFASTLSSPFVIESRTIGTMACPVRLGRYTFIVARLRMYTRILERDTAAPLTQPVSRLLRQ